MKYLKGYSEAPLISFYVKYGHNTDRNYPEKHKEPLLEFNEH